MRWLLILIVKGYSKLVSPLLHGLVGPMGGCRFSPGCAQYALEALRRHGALKGSLLALWRVARCHRWHPGGYDPVPAKAFKIGKKA